MSITGIGEIGDAVGKVSDLVKGLVDRWFPPDVPPEKKLEAIQAMTTSIEEREAAVTAIKAQIMVAELNQDDRFTKRARPMIVYMGLLFMAINHVFFPCVSWAVQAINGADNIMLPIITLPTEFWYVWGGVCGIYVLGRSAEKRGDTTDELMKKAAGLIISKK